LVVVLKVIRASEPSLEGRKNGKAGKRSGGETVMQSEEETGSEEEETTTT
jgi:hypothetical protein